MTTTEQISQELKALPPTLPEPEDRLEHVERRVVRRRRRLAAATAGGALALVLAGWGLTEVVSGPEALGPAGTEETSSPGVEFSNRSPGTILGSSETGEPTMLEGTGAEEIDLPSGPYPDGTDALRLSVTCADTAELMWPHRGTVLGCPTSDPGTDRFPAAMLVPLSAADEPYSVQVSREVAWELTVTPVEVDRIPLGVNAQGQTYGVDTPLGRPDLMEVQREDLVSGYLESARVEELAGPDPQTFEERDAYRAVEREPLEVPMYASDGVTVRGSYELQVPADER